MAKPMSYKYTTAELKLLDAIHANSREDGPRLAYADWLERHRQVEYAEFIRLQCEQARGHSDKYLVVPESAREAELRGRFGQVWAAPFPALKPNAAFKEECPPFNSRGRKPGVRSALNCRKLSAMDPHGIT